MRVNSVVRDEVRGGRYHPYFLPVQVFHESRQVNLSNMSYQLAAVEGGSLGRMVAMEPEEKRQYVLRAVSRVQQDMERDGTDLCNEHILDLIFALRHCFGHYDENQALLTSLALNITQN